MAEQLFKASASHRENVSRKSLVLYIVYNACIYVYVVKNILRNILRNIKESLRSNMNEDNEAKARARTYDRPTTCYVIRNSEKSLTRSKTRRPTPACLSLTRHENI